MSLARQGEAFAAAYYRDHGYQLLETNAYFACGEIDLIVQDPAGPIIFIEVKTRTSPDFGAAEAVDAAKLKRMRAAAMRWLSDKSWQEVRFDVLELTVIGRHLDSDGEEHLLFDVHCFMGVEDGAC
ncbi:YraN family protein [Corynebacterium caspium]|uniref:YraN family protein n=1 Tax=Corynebacterium caspium TaxID=234828 RepID=UPI00039D7994|nr:YraN family protein [Corynebacterium caspium]